MRDLGLRRVSVVTRGLVAVSVAAVGAFSALAAWSHPGRSKTTTTSTPLRRTIRGIRLARHAGPAVTPTTLTPATQPDEQHPGHPRTAPQPARPRLPVRPSAGGLGRDLDAWTGHSRSPRWERPPRSSSPTTHALEHARAIFAAEIDAIDARVQPLPRRLRADARQRRTPDGRPPSRPLSSRRSTSRCRAARITDGLVDPTVGTAMRALGYDRDFAALDRDGPPLAVAVAARSGLAARSRSTPSGRRCASRPVSSSTSARPPRRCAPTAPRDAIAHATGAGVLVSLGGDLAVGGPRPTSGWPVVRDRRRPRGRRPTAPASAIRIAVGRARHVGHDGAALAPRRSQPAPRRRSRRPGCPRAEHWRTVSVAAASCVDANIASTAAIVMGADAPAWLEDARPARPARARATARSRYVGGWPDETSDRRRASRGDEHQGAVVPHARHRPGEPGPADVERRARHRGGGALTRAAAGRGSCSRRCTATRRCSRSRSSRVHIVTAVADSFAPIRLLDAFVPFVGAYRPLWLGLGAVAFDLLLALVVTSLLRERLGYRAWRAVHWAAYACWPVALLHGLGTGSDTRVRWALVVNVALPRRRCSPRCWWRVGVDPHASAGTRARVAAFGERRDRVRRRRVDAARADAAGLGAQGGHAERAAHRRRRRRRRARSTLADPVRERGCSGSIAAATRARRHRHRDDRSHACSPMPGDARLHVAIDGHGRSTAAACACDSSTRARSAPTSAPDLYQGHVVNLDGTDVVAVLRRPNGAHITRDRCSFSIDARSSAVGGTVDGPRREVAR